MDKGRELCAERKRDECAADDSKGSHFIADYLPSGPHFVATVAAALCLLLAFLLLASVSTKWEKPSKQ
ncbi:hypothetical protein NL676_018778 [Syzygium grande]|nr:hypothetical protein NL676_018778 [Syzygium grande]